jgi:hypothetical protein
MGHEHFHRQRVLKALVWLGQNGSLLAFAIFICVVPLVLVRYHYSSAWSTLGVIAFIAWHGLLRR